MLVPMPELHVPIYQGKSLESVSKSNLPSHNSSFFIYVIIYFELVKFTDNKQVNKEEDNH